MPEVKANKVAGFDQCILPGDFYITAPNPRDLSSRRLSFRCPCGCAALCGIRIRDDDTREGGAWAWDRDEDTPTVTPSININNDHWHGHLTKGVFKNE